jgi:ectoine hydroxylase-related dioxygenase (phytanoyl-CoA dioxygenase family)
VITLSSLERDGFLLASGLATAGEIAALISFFETAELSSARRRNETFGARNLLAFPEISNIASSPQLTALLDPLLGPGHRAVRGLFFDKTENANWPVLWHQDLSLAVREHRHLPGWSNWSVKHGVPHVQPPAALLARMVTLRLHLDDCDGDNGPLRLIPGSHRHGCLSRAQIQECVRKTIEHIVVAKAGDALLLRPLIVHASSAAARPTHRRVLHLEFAPAELLPPGLAWAAV